ncbi:MAG: iron-containing alcohol dehydrogenase, partial [Streptococcus parasanguinis]|nr:iron-containing alcohol dehydrogenase [Streptococcus parasanguinis]
MRNFASPSRYIQGENALFENAQSISELGNHPVLLCDSVVYDIVGKRFEEYLGQNGLTVLPVFFNGEASDNEINRVVSLAEENGCDLVIGLG